MSLKKTISVLLLILSQHAFSQQPFMYHLTDEDGLPSMEVYNMLQDRKGFIWVGTDNGICRYDGKRFKLYYHPKQRGKSFSHLCEDHLGRIWTVNFAGQIFYIEHDTLKLFEPFEKIYVSSFPRISISKDKHIWIMANGNSIHYAHLDTLTLHQYPTPGNHFFVSIVTDAQNNVIAQGDSIYRIILHQPMQSATGEKPGMIYAEGTQQVLFCSTTRSGPRIESLDIKHLLTKNFNTQVFKGIQSRVTDLRIFSEEDAWLLTFDGVYSFKLRERTCSDRQELLKGNAISWMIKDREGNYWFSTLKNGIFIMPSKFVWTMDATNSALPENRISRIDTDASGNLYLGTGRGHIVKINRQTNKIERTIQLDRSQQDVELLKIDRKRNLMVTQNNNLYEINLLTFQRTQLPGLSSLKDVSFDDWGNRYVSNSFFAAIIPAPKGAASPFTRNLPPVRKYYHYQLQLARIQRGVCNLLSATDTSIWFGYVDGIYVYHRGREMLVKNEFGQPIYPTRMHQDEHGTIWIATVQQGIYAFKNRRQVLHLTQENGLKSNFIRCIKAYRNSVWFGTDKGVQSYNTITQKLQSFTKEDGLLTNDVLDIHIDGNRVYLATSKGLQWFDATQLRTNLVSPMIYISETTLNDTQVISEDMSVLKSWQNNLTFNFIGIATSSRGNMHYAYRLVGLNNQWKYVNANEHYARFVSLPPGTYTFEVKAVNEDGTESENSVQKSFTITPPYWQRWWFVTLMAFILISVVSLLFLVRIRIIQRRNKLQTDKTKLEIELRSSQLSALKVQMNPHFIFNALNSIQEYILTNEKKLANSYLGKFSDLMRLYLDMSNKRSVSLDEEVKALNLYLELEAMRFEDTFDYNVAIQESLQADHIFIPPMIIQPYIENAIKHGLLHRRTQRKLSVKITSANTNTLICEVEDNGIGRKQSMELNQIRNRKHASFATGATQKRLELLNNERTGDHKIGVTFIDLLNGDGSPAGTRVILTIPFEA